VVARGWCRRHYQRWKLKGDPGPVDLVRMPNGSSCTVDGCDNPNMARGYCEMHRWRVRAKGEPGPAGQLKPYARRQREPCSVDGCDRPRSGNQAHCRLHHERLRRTGSLGPPQPVYIKGIVKPRSDGYRRIHVGNGRRVLEHVHVMEQMLGRRLVPPENVHHKNGVGHDNDPGNLELWLKMQPSGQRVADLMEYIAEYHAGAMAEILARKKGAGLGRDPGAEPAGGLLPGQPGPEDQ